MRDTALSAWMRAWAIAWEGRKYEDALKVVRDELRRVGNQQGEDLLLLRRAEQYALSSLTGRPLEVNCGFCGRTFMMRDLALIGGPSAVCGACLQIASAVLAGQPVAGWLRVLAAEHGSSSDACAFCRLPARPDAELLGIDKQFICARCVEVGTRNLSHHSGTDHR